MNTQDAAQELLAGRLVVFPTETVYGLGALASDNEAVKKIFTVKGRPAINPLIVHIAREEQLTPLVREIPESAKKLMKRFWPGPLTICFRKSDQVSDLVTAGLPTVCIRRPDNAIAQELLELVGQPVAAPSANLSGKPSTTTFDDAKKQLEQKGVFFLDGGEAPLGLESTVVDCSGTTVKLLRPGFVSKTEIEAVLDHTIVDETHSGEITSPGQLLDHYAPQGTLTVISGEREQRRSWIQNQNFERRSNLAFGIVGSEGEQSWSGKTFSLCDNEQDLETYAARLYRFLNWCDHEQVDQIILELPSYPHPLFEVLKNRLQKASRGNIIDV